MLWYYLTYIPSIPTNKAHTSFLFDQELVRSIYSNNYLIKDWYSVSLKIAFQYESNDLNFVQDNEDTWSNMHLGKRMRELTTELQQKNRSHSLRGRLDPIICMEFIFIFYT